MAHEEKAALRRQLLAARLTISAHERHDLDGRLCLEIARHPAFLSASALLLYLPMRGEPDLTPLFSLAEGRGIPVYLPRCEGAEMHFYLFEGEACLTPDRFGIKAPPPTAKHLTADEKALCILPGLAADKQGNRLGYGGGFYDKFLQTFGGNTLFALYHCFLLDALPQEPHDAPISHIITEKGEFFRAEMDTTSPTV